MTTSESWKTIEKFPDYAVSDLGRVKRITPARIGRRIEQPGRVLKPSINRGYTRVVLASPNGIWKTCNIHSLVLEAFVCPCPGGKECCHYDGDPGNNKLSNLRWGTSKENHADRKRHGKVAVGERHGRSKLKESQVRDIRKLSGIASQREIAEAFGISPLQVGKIQRREMWKHVP